MAAAAVLEPAVAECRRCGTWLGDGHDRLCEDCMPADCRFCGTTVPRMDLTAQGACPTCTGEELA